MRGMQARMPSMQWRPLTPSCAGLLPRAVWPWVRLESSMTQKLTERVGQSVRVNLMRQDRDSLHPDERILFQPRKRKGYVREVCLYSGGARLLAARTVMVSDRLAGRAELASLGTRPLGELLFRDGRAAKWTLREYALIGPASPLYPQVRQCTGRRLLPCWARRSMFVLEGESLLVTEIFLPSMLERASGRHIPSIHLKDNHGIHRTGHQ